MPIVMYQCVTCGDLHETNIRPTGGSVFLRCISTRTWAWHEPSRFLSGPVDSASAAPAAVQRGPRAASRSAGKAAKPASKKPARRAPSRRAPARKASASPRKAAKKRTR